MYKSNLLNITYNVTVNNQSKFIIARLSPKCRIVEFYMPYIHTQIAHGTISFSLSNSIYNVPKLFADGVLDYNKIDDQALGSKQDLLKLHADIVTTDHIGDVTIYFIEDAVNALYEAKKGNVTKQALFTGDNGFDLWGSVTGTLPAEFELSFILKVCNI